VSDERQKSDRPADADLPGRVRRARRAHPL